MDGHEGGLRRFDPRAARAVDTARRRRAGAAAVAIALAAALALAAPGRARAGDGNDLGADAIVVVPFGDWATQVGVGLGAAARVRVPLSTDLTVVARLGAIDHLAHDGLAAPGVTATTRELELPLTGGARWYVSGPGRARGYFSGEVGVVLRRIDVALDGAHDTEWRFVFATALGAGVEVGPVEVGASVWFADLGKVDHTAGAMVTAGATFARW